jgi:hypothetical protein
MADNPQIENNFTAHDLASSQREQCEAIRSRAKDFAYLIDKMCPNSREKSQAIINLELVMMWSNAAIARNQIP